MSKVQIFVSFDIEHDEDLYELLLAQSRTPSSGFAVSGASKRSTGTTLESESLRRRIREADQVIFICGEHTDASAPVSAELLIAREERIRYFLLWGRRDSNCTKPKGAQTNEGMYNWTGPILQDRIAFTSRKAITDAAAATLHAHGRKR